MQIICIERDALIDNKGKRAAVINLYIKYMRICINVWSYTGTYTCIVHIHAFFVCMQITCIKYDARMDNKGDPAAVMHLYITYMCMHKYMVIHRYIYMHSLCVCKLPVSSVMPSSTRKACELLLYNSTYKVHAYA